MLSRNEIIFGMRFAKLIMCRRAVWCVAANVSKDYNVFYTSTNIRQPQVNRIAGNLSIQVKFVLEQVMMVQRGSRGTTLLFFNLVTLALDEVGCQRHAPSALPSGIRDLVPIA